MSNNLVQIDKVFFTVDGVNGMAVTPDENNTIVCTPENSKIFVNDLGKSLWEITFLNNEYIIIFPGVTELDETPFELVIPGQLYDKEHLQINSSKTYTLLVNGSHKECKTITLKFD